MINQSQTKIVRFVSLKFYVHEQHNCLQQKNYVKLHRQRRSEKPNLAHSPGYFAKSVLVLWHCKSQLVMWEQNNLAKQQVCVSLIYLISVDRFKFSLAILLVFFFTGKIKRKQQVNCVDKFNHKKFSKAHCTFKSTKIFAMSAMFFPRFMVVDVSQNFYLKFSPCVINTISVAQCFKLQFFHFVKKC